MTVKNTFEKVTPAMAERWLNQNNTNRSLREGVVEQYAKDMREGNWTQCTQPIAFYEDGDLADGQHRLYALIESNTTQEFIVLKGLTRRDGLNIDTGVARSIVDNGRISGLDTELSNSLISTARALASGMPSNGRMSNSDKLAVVAEHRDAAQWAVSVLPRTKGIYNSAILAALGRAWYTESDHERLAKFAQVLGTGFSDGDADSAAIAMRNYIMTSNGLAASAAMWRDTFLKCMHAIGYFMKRQRLTNLRSVKEEAYPLKKKRVLKKAA